MSSAAAPENPSFFIPASMFAKFTPPKPSQAEKPKFSQNAIVGAFSASIGGRL
jgi:hypothetical protein